MAENGAQAQTGAGERVAIGITFGNSNSSIAYTIDDKPEVMANEDGGKCNSHVFKHRKKLISSVQTVKYLRYCPTLMVRSTTVARQSPSSFATPTTPSHTSRSS